MKANGSVLIVVLGLLAILAVVGVAFITMSTIDRSTAANFALNTQVMMAADGGVEYASQILVSDVWQVSGSGATRKYLLLTGAANYEVFDGPGPDDLWLTDPITTVPTAPGNITLKQGSVTRYLIPFNSTTAGCDNLGIGGTNGVFISDLAFPFEGYVGRVSLTILDHGGLINLNAHGNASSAGWTGAALRGLGYYISDVSPGAISASNLLFSPISGGHGRWGIDSSGVPNIPETGETCIEYPTLNTTNYPFTLDEEFELRRVQPNPLVPSNGPGTLALSRAELMCGGSNNSLNAAQRLMYTTVGWTAEVSGDGNSAAHRVGTGAIIWSRPKADVNRAKAQDIFEALNDGRAGTSKQLGQLTANIIAFRSSNNAFSSIAVPGATGTPFVGADRQPLITEATCKLTHPSSGPGDNNVYEIKVEIYNPWPNEVPGPEAPLNTASMTVNAADSPENLPATMAARAFQVITKSISLSPAVSITTKSIKLTVNRGKEVTLDEITGADMSNLASSGHLSRKILVASETRGTGCNIPILYLRDWDAAGAEGWNSVTTDASLEGTVPIRFPNSVTASTTDWSVATTEPILPPFASGGTNFRGIARLGDLDQVLCPKSDTDATNFWPWTNRVAKCTSEALEADLKFCWKPKGVIGVGTSDLSLAANVLSVGGPWDDQLDNDGDAKTDTADTGALGPSWGRAGGPELRVAGRVNLNTLTPTSMLPALNDGLGLSLTASDLVNRPWRTPAQILNTVSPGTGTEARGYLEKRDWAFNRLSNIATIRSDTYSVYGTVQLGTVPPVGGSTFTVARSRRFWALLDRSVSLAYPPGNSNYMHPRILNFQWLD